MNELVGLNKSRTIAQLARAFVSTLPSTAFPVHGVARSKARPSASRLAASARPSARPAAA